jgi:hypothetical protein
MQLTDTDYASALTSVMKLTPEIILTRCQVGFPFSLHVTFPLH